MEEESIGTFKSTTISCTFKYPTKVYAISYPPLDHEIAGFGGLF